MENLNEDEKKRYQAKITPINGVDPYQINVKSCSRSPSDFPKVTWGDVVNYLVYTQSAYTMVEFKAFKSLEAYNLFACGWVKAVVVKELNSLCVLLSEVQHSQRLNEKHLKVWIIVERSGIVQSAHCTCVAGISEACSHVGATLFYVQDAVIKLQQMTVTDVPAYWVAPSGKTVRAATVDDIDFTTPLKMCQKNEKPTVSSKQHTSKGEMTDEEFHEFLRELQKVEPNAAILNVVKPYCEDSKKQYPMELPSIFDPNLVGSPLSLLQRKACHIQISVSYLEVKNLEEDTKKQARSSLWLRQRAGRITASKFKAVCSTSIEDPSMSLVKSICYPACIRLTSRAVTWGCTHEGTARKQYIKQHQRYHLEFKVTNSGLFVNPDYPEFGASPDGLINCVCCGEGLLEIKCPYCLREKENLNENDPKSCLETNGNQTTLKKIHPYYYQVQCQLFITQREYCDFVLWTEKTLFVQRITKDEELWKENMPTARSFFYLVILPELLAKHFTAPSSTSQVTKPSPLIVKL